MLSRKPRWNERIKFRAWRHDGGPKYRIVRVMQRLEVYNMPSWSGRELKTFERWEFKAYLGEVPFIEFHPESEMIIDYFFSTRGCKRDAPNY